MIALIENLLLALTDSQFDKILMLIVEACKAASEGVKTVWLFVSPVLGLYLAFKCKEIISNQKANREALDENTKISTEAFDAANNFNVKAEALAQAVSDIKHKTEP
jgi:hypothetical protein